MRAVQGFELEGLYVDASYAPLQNGGTTEQAVDLHASTGVVLDSVVLTNQGGSSCVFGGTSRSALITHSLITSCGAHGVYGGNTATGLAVRHSWIEGVVHSCQKMTHAVSNHHYYGVVCNKNAYPYEGMIFNDTPTGNVVENSVVTGFYYPSLVAAANYAGSNNFVLNNCLYPAPYFGASNVRAGGNVVAYPQIAGFTITNPTCAAKLPADSPFRPASA